ncbi:MAG: UvrD-helicase domain-containing protein [Halolamina sp.]|uniref:UvrD-helicase domain-containing protein n=1 Tax=Halolamina sp. TaxID=1940283 RepID=UPI002FC36EA9
MTEEPSAEADSESDGYRQLEGVQAEIRDAFFSRESGLFVLDCGPGAGKSVTVDSVAAEDLARKTAVGAESPAETLCLTSFSRDDAASILPGVEAALVGLATDSAAPVPLSEADAAGLAAALRGSDRVGTIDSVLGGVFDAIAEEVGFDGVPDVGDSSALAGVHGDALTIVRGDDSFEGVLAQLDDAYPEGRFDDDLNDLLATARSACRERRLGVDGLRDRLEAVVEGAYPDGPPASLAAVLRDVTRFFGPAERDAVEDRLAADPDGEPDAVVTADAACYEEWHGTIEAFCTVLDAYLDAYDEACRANGVVAHVDVAHWIATFFAEPRYASPFRERLRERYTNRLSTVIVDEAQDVSRAQHDALAPLVDADSRVLLVGDRNQSIYAWRNAQPSLFAAAVEDGEYFGVDWTTHEAARATRTYRCRPEVAAAIDTVFDPVFTDPTRGGTGDGDYQPLTTVRKSIAEPSLHIAAFGGRGQPGNGTWIDPADGVGEAQALADCIAAGLSDGRFETADTAEPGVTVLFQRRTHMGSYIDAFADAGLSVRDTSRALFDHPLVGAVCGVVEWLEAPTSQSKTLELTNDDALPLNTLVDRLMRSDWSIQAVADSGRLSGTEGEFVDGLAELAERRPSHLAGAGADVVSDVIETLSLASDPFDRSTAATDDIAVLDRLVATVVDWEGEETYSLAQLAAALGHARRNSRRGPSLPTKGQAVTDKRAATTDGADVTFRTIHGAKGDEDDVVAVADLGAGLGRIGPYLDRFLSHGRHVGLAPPGTHRTEDDYPSLDGTVLAGGPYNPKAKPDDDHAGLRWASERWVPGEDRLAGPAPSRGAVADTRAERWRLLFVALSRARDHLVLPLPERRDEPEPRDRWVDTLRQAFEFDASSPAEYTVGAPGHHEPVRVAVHRPTGPEPKTASNTAETGDPAKSAPKPDPVPPRGWTPRFVNPSTVYALSTSPDEHVLAHLSGRALHTDHAGVSEALPLTFETMSPAVVGDVAHDVFTVALDRSVTTTTLQEGSGPLPAAVDRALRCHTRGVAHAERERLRQYVEGTLLPALAESALWERLQESRQLYVEEPLDAIARVGGNGQAGVDVEIGGEADIVSVDAEGRWRVDDLKVVLKPLDRECWDRYELQAATYALALARQLGVEAVHAAVTTVGVESGTRQIESGSAEVRTALEQLSDLDWETGGRR